MSFRPTPALTMNDAVTVLDAGLQAIGAGQVSIDLSGLSAVDSAAVATLLAWQRAARRRGQSLTFQNVPANLHSLIVLYGVEDLIQSAPNSLAIVGAS